ncbi:PspA/IM30 family protein [Acanthopleuribacter pedis]|uniref:PspA/IM30 family protein n=1 Tax=Acanthopleuribacter pedis TaxID=442870 RepID=A0A8J7QIH1_9BACT|nr:PspA/IM30 family protein [Acanthopleuribacter pedis]MBO1321341.1 PspA/IM30 family protein [Acanthopleuribacter pedis]
MGIFSRISEIVNSNVNSILEKAENPEKLVKLMIHEMEDTLTEVKSSAAEVVADRIRIERALDTEKQRVSDWQAKANLALDRNREDLAKEALEQKLTAEGKVRELTEQHKESTDLSNQYQGDIGRLEEKLEAARGRQRLLIAGHKSAKNRRAVEDKIYRINTTGAFAKFENYEKRIDRYRAEAEVMSISNQSLEKKFSDLVKNEAVELELQRLKEERGIATKEHEAIAPPKKETAAVG